MVRRLGLGGRWRGEVGRVTRELGNEEGIEYGAVEPPPEPEPGQSTAFKGKKKKGLR